MAAAERINTYQIEPQPEQNPLAEIRRLTQHFSNGHTKKQQPIPYMRGDVYLLNEQRDAQNNPESEKQYDQQTIQNVTEQIGQLVQSLGQQKAALALRFPLTLLIEAVKRNDFQEALRYIRAIGDKAREYMN